jgi:hypothetical protein
MVANKESTTRTGIRLSTSAAPVKADWYVAESFEDNVTQTTPSAPSSAAAVKASAKAPGEGADVSGSTDVLAH